LTFVDLLLRWRFGKKLNSDIILSFQKIVSINDSVTKLLPDRTVKPGQAKEVGLPGTHASQLMNDPVNVDEIAFVTRYRAVHHVGQNTMSPSATTIPHIHGKRVELAITNTVNSSSSHNITPFEKRLLKNTVSKPAGISVMSAGQFTFQRALRL